MAESQPAKTAELHQESNEEILKKLGLDQTTIDALKDVKSQANLEASFGFLDKIASFEVMDVPVGAVAIGTALTIAIDRFILAKVDPTNKWGSWANLAAAFLMKNYVGKFIGNKSADITALLLTYEAIADWVTQAFNNILPPATTTTTTQQQGSVLRQAATVVNDYYAGMYRR